MKRFEFHLDISAEKYLDYYRGALRHVVVSYPNGQVIQFPASLLTPFVMASGIHGEFVLTCDDHYKMARLCRALSGKNSPEHS
jgi:Protein of unknown function (DUF2835)